MSPEAQTPISSSHSNKGALVPVDQVVPESHRKRLGIAWKITGALLGTVLLFGLLALAVVYRYGGQLLQHQIDQKALALGVNLADAVAGLMASRNVLHLNATTTKYAILPGVAYAYVQDRSGEALAYSPGSFPAELERERSSNVLREPWTRQLTFHGRPVQETIVPILGGQLGTAHLGMWNDLVQEEIRKAILPMIVLISCLLALSLLLSLIVSRQIVRPILRLSDAADNMSRGDLDTPVGLKSIDEIGELALSLERMRASLKAAMVRLTRDNPQQGLAQSSEKVKLTA
jgi:HAMP domain-containing protein